MPIPYRVDRSHRRPPASLSATATFWHVSRIGNTCVNHKRRVIQLLGSHSLVAPGVGFAANMSGGLTLLAVAAVYLVAWLRRERLRAAPADQALVVLALLLALMTFGKVLSPQYFIWILPAWALVAARDRWIAVLGGLTLALTQAEFPALYWNLLDMQPLPLAIVVARNTLLLANVRRHRVAGVGLAEDTSGTSGAATRLSEAADTDSCLTPNAPTKVLPEQPWLW